MQDTALQSSELYRYCVHSSMYNSLRPGLVTRNYTLLVLAAFSDPNPGQNGLLLVALVLLLAGKPLWRPVQNGADDCLLIFCWEVFVLQPQYGLMWKDVGGDGISR